MGDVRIRIGTGPIRRVGHMSGLDLHLLSSGDASAALRSYPRRFRSVLAPHAGDPEPVDALAQRVGPDGRSSADRLTDAVRSLAIIEQALRQVLIDDQPVVHEAVIDPGARHWEHPGTGSLADALAELDDATADLAAAIDKVASGDWDRTGAIAGSDGARTVTALDLVREAVRTAADDLRGIETTMAAVRGQR